jgi:hypothetical protein
MSRIFVTLLYLGSNLLFCFLQAAAWVVLGIVAIIRLNFDYLLVVGVCVALSVANVIGFTKCNKGISHPFNLKAVFIFISYYFLNHTCNIDFALGTFVF